MPSFSDPLSLSLSLSPFQISYVLTSPALVLSLSARLLCVAEDPSLCELPLKPEIKDDHEEVRHFSFEIFRCIFKTFLSVIKFGFRMSKMSGGNALGALSAELQHLGDEIGNVAHGNDQYGGFDSDSMLLWDYSLSRNCFLYLLSQIFDLVTLSALTGTRAA